MKLLVSFRQLMKNPALDPSGGKALMGRRPGRNWYEVYLLILAMVFVGGAWATGSEAQVIAATFPSWSQYLWYGGLLAGSLVALVGIGMNTVTGFLVERGALFWLAGLCGCYGLAFLALAERADTFHAAYVITFVLGFGAVNLARARQVRSEIDRMRAQLRDLAQRDKPEALP